MNLGETKMTIALGTGPEIIETSPIIQLLSRTVAEGTGTKQGEEEYQWKESEIC